MSTGLELILNASTATSAPGGANAARVQNDVGDLCLWSMGNVGLRVTATTGAVGVGKAASVSTAALDVSGNMNASGLLGCISNSVSTTSSTVAASSTAVKAANDLAALALPKSGGAVTGTLAVNKTSVTGSYALDVSGGVNATIIATNGIAVGTLVSGTLTLPSYATNTGYNMFSLSITAGTWLLTGGCAFAASSSGGTFYSAIGPGSANVGQGNQVSVPLTTSATFSLTNSIVVTVSSTTTYYLCVQVNGGTGVYQGSGNVFQAVKIA